MASRSSPRTIAIGDCVAHDPPYGEHQARKRGRSEPFSERNVAQLGSGEPITRVCEAAGISAEQFDAWWKAEARSRVPHPPGTLMTGVRRPVRIDRDGHGIPHIHAENDEDLFFAFGYAHGAGSALSARLSCAAEAAAGSPRCSGRTGASWTCSAAWSAFAPSSNWICSPAPSAFGTSPRRNGSVFPRRRAYSSTPFRRGVNSLMEQTRDTPPIEFDLLDYRPEPWSPVDCLTIESRISLVSHGAVSGDRHPGTGEAGPGRRVALPRLPARREGRRKHPARRARIRVAALRRSRSARGHGGARNRHRAATTGSLAG